MNESLQRYLDALERTNNQEYLMTEAEKQEFAALFREHPELDQLRTDLLNQDNPEFRRTMVKDYMDILSSSKDLTGQMNDLGFNLKDTKDITLNNGERIIVMYKQNSDVPIVLHVDSNVNIVSELKERMTSDPKYQGSDLSSNAEALLDDYARDNNAYQPIQEISKYDPATSKYAMDLEKQKVIAELIKKAAEKNVLLSGQDKFMYIDEDNNYIMTGTGKVLEAEIDTLTGNITVGTAADAVEYKNEGIDVSSDGSTSSDGSRASEETEKDSEYSSSEIDYVYEEVFAKGGADPSKKDETVEKLNEIANNPDEIYNMSKEEQEWYQTAYNMLISKRKTLTYAPKDNQSGVSNYLYIAIFVLLVAFAVLMYFVFKR